MSNRTHKIRPEELTVNLSLMALASAFEMKQLFSNAINEAIQRYFPKFFEDAIALHHRFEGYEQKNGIELTDEEIYTLYVSLDLMGRIFTSEYKELFFAHMVKGEVLSDFEAQQFIVQTALPNIDNFFRVTEMYAAQTNSLANLPDVKRRLGLLPMFDWVTQIAVSISVVSLSGVVEKSFKFMEGATTYDINLQGLPNGIYFVRTVEGSKMIGIEKVLLNR